MASLPTYTPPTDVAFKQRLYSKVGKTIADDIVAHAVAFIPNNYLVEGDNRMVVPDNVMWDMEIDYNKYVLISVVNKGVYMEKPQLRGTIRNQGTWKGITIWGLLIQFSNFGFDDKKPIKPDAVYDAPTDNDWGRSVGERGIVEEKIEPIAEKVPVEPPVEELPDTSKKKVKK